MHPEQILHEAYEIMGGNKTIEPSADHLIAIGNKMVMLARRNEQLEKIIEEAIKMHEKKNRKKSKLILMS
jgi:short-subunit dehydrogenase involved in D-alanine esterification of teichoic acids